MHKKVQEQLLIFLLVFTFDHFQAEKHKEQKGSLNSEFM